MMSAARKVLLLIMDGWGWREDRDGNAVLLARTPNVDRLWRTMPHTLIHASGPRVGLPEGQMGNSEVGHLNLGAGRVVHQDIVRIDRAIADGSMFANEVLCDAMDGVTQDSKLHLIGLVSDGGVHSHLEHLYALVRMAKQRGVHNVCVHAILDGRDTPPHAGKKYLAALESTMREIGCGAIATVVGRFYGMDRDRRWDRTQKAFALFTSGVGASATDAIAAVESSYAAGITDEFVEPIAISADGNPVGLVGDGDTVLFFNFRADRARQLTHAFTDEKFAGFERAASPRVHYVCMTRYEDSLPLPVVFSAVSRRNVLGEIAAANGMKGLRIAETEKYAHVTYFFNGGEEREFEGETRILIPSLKVRTYDLKPEMSAAAIADRLVDEIRSERHDYIVCNFANPDMVGHTGVLEAAITACETVDTCVGRVIESLELKRWVAIVTADHGNAEQMVDYANGGSHTAHTTNPVPCILVDPAFSGSLISDGALRDIAPTICNYLGIKLPPEMTGHDLRVGA